MYPLLELLEKCLCGLFSFNRNSQNTNKIHPEQKPPTIFLDQPQQPQLDTHLMQKVCTGFAAKQLSTTFINRIKNTTNSQQDFEQLVIKDIQNYISQMTGVPSDAIIIRSPRTSDPEPDDNNKPSP